MKKLTTRLAAATALALMMTEMPSIAAQREAASPSIDGIITGAAPQLLAQNDAPAADEAPAEEEGQPRKKRRQVQEAPAEAAPQAAEPAPAPQAAEPAPEPQKQAEPEPAPRKKRVVAEPEAPAAEQPAQQAAPEAVTPPADGQAEETPRDKRQRERREAQQQKQQKAAEPKAEEQKPADTAQPAQPPAVQPPAETAQPQAPAVEPPPADTAQPQAPAVEPPAADTAQPQAPAVEPPPADTAQPQKPVLGEQPVTAQPGTDKLPENSAPVLDSQKPNEFGGDKTAQPQQPEKPPVAAGPPPKTDSEAQKEKVDIKDIIPASKEEGKRIEGDKQPRRERREGSDVLREIGGRVIIDLGGRPTVESNDGPRMERGARDVYYDELPRGRTRETIVRENGVQIVTVRDRYGEVIRRSRITPEGREYVLVYVDEERRGDRDGAWRDPGDDLPPLVLDIPVDEYILDSEDAENDEAYYEFLDQPPVEQVERYYSVDEVKRSARVRDSVRRVDLDTITFEFGSAEIKEDAIPRLDGVAKAMAKMLEKNPAETFLIEGHTDAVGSDLANLALSDKRAEAVAAALTDVFEIPPENLTTQGYGEQYLKIKSAVAEEANRRVAIRRITALVSPEVAAK